ncbi:PD-(D/E)XK motif protein [Cytobacillus kochii]
MKWMRVVIWMINPWEELTQLSRIRVKAAMQYNAFWVMDARNRYGLIIQCDKDFHKSSKEFDLKGIQIELDYTSDPNQLILLLKDSKDWEIFLILCNDLINMMKEYDKDVIKKVMLRLERWQRLLQRTSLKVMSKEEQMGLYSELFVLQEYIIPAYGIKEGINSWVGPFGDKQDFLLERFAIEVKSYRITKGNSIWISSKEQLNSEKNPLYLFVCALNEGNNGETVEGIIQRIYKTIESKDLQENFIEKIESYGYVREVQKESLTKFKLEYLQGYEVSEEFPKIALTSLSPLIKSVNYTIDLSGCSNFKVDNLTKIFV